MEKFNKEIWKTFGEKFENVNTLIQKADTYKEETNKQMDSGFNNLDETLDSTSEGFKVSTNMEENIKKIKKIWRKKIFNTKEEMEMRKGGLINIFNKLNKHLTPINKQRELNKVRNCRQNSIKISKVSHHRIITKNLNKFKYLNISMINEYLTTSIISSIRSIPAEHCINNT